MSDNQQWARADLVARVASTRPVQVRGDAHVTRFSRDALADTIEQVRGRFVPLLVEHLDYIPPIGRWYDGRLIDADDGETELELIARNLPQLTPVGDDPPDPLLIVEQLDVSQVPAAVQATLHFEPRNFSQSALQEIRRTAPVPLHEEHRWSELPPLIWTLVFAGATWSATKFVGAFLEEVGHVSGQAFAAWVRRMWNSAEESDRDRILAVQFVLPHDAVVSAFISVPHADPNADALLTTAIDQLGNVASFVGMQLEHGVLGDITRAAVFWDGNWHLGWWTDGEAVYRTHWYDQHAPDPTKILGRPLLDTAPPQEIDPPQPGSSRDTSAG